MSTRDRQQDDAGTLSRAGFLYFVGQAVLYLAGAIGLAAVWRYLAYTLPEAGVQEVDLGDSTDYPPGTRRLLPAARALVIHDAKGLRALDLLCPHLGCLVEEDADGFRCPCHGSRYDREGNLLRGPAARGLRPLALTVGQDGALTARRTQD